MEGMSELQKYRKLSQKNKKALEVLADRISSKGNLFAQQNFNYNQIKQQYEIILQASRESIEYNTQLQTQLDERKQILTSLKSKLQKNTIQLEGLTHEAKRASGHLIRQRNSRKEIFTHEKDVKGMKKSIDKLIKKKEELINEERKIDQKENQLNISLVKLNEQLREMQSVHKNEDSELLQKIYYQQSQIRRLREELYTVKQINSSRLVTPDRSRGKKVDFSDVCALIRQQKQQL